MMLFSFFIVAFGQPAWVPFLGLLAAIFGYALFWRSILEITNITRKFWIATFWFSLVQLVQLSWLTTHPFLYIYPVYVLFACLIGAQFGLLSILITKETIRFPSKLIGIAGLWTILEWSRLFFVSGYTWNPVGLALTGSIFPLQTASLWGIYGLSFCVILVNLFFLRLLFYSSARIILLTAAIATFPYVYGWAHLQYHQTQIETTAQGPTLSAALVQTAFPIEENLHFQSYEEAVDYVYDEWVKILFLLKKQKGINLDLIALPEYVVPYGTYVPIFALEKVRKAFEDTFGEEGLKALPPLQEPMASWADTPSGPKWFVSNSFWIQSLANLFECAVIAGLQDEEWISSKEYVAYSTASFFLPNLNTSQRYEKRILVPMGEYIPLEFLKKLAASYGISGSFTHGKEAKVFHGGKVPFGVSICYEETFGNLMRENRQKGAQALVNLTSDAWFPNSKLPQQHFDHAKLRSVESGIPILRACNTGITGAVDSLGNVVKTLGNGTSESEWMADSLHVEVPTYHYQTLYSRQGDTPLIAFSILSLLFLIRRKKD